MEGATAAEGAAVAEEAAEGEGLLREAERERVERATEAEEDEGEEAAAACPRQSRWAEDDEMVTAAGADAAEEA